jgi:ribosome-associated toxin RatA of RatAB toxin-antitoxin module
MTTIHRSALLPFHARQLFELVNDVEAYPQYMDGCVGARVLHREEQLIEARLDLARGGISQSFSTRNRMTGFEQISLELLEGPFDYFEGRWNFKALGEAACKISLNLEFRVNSAILGAAAGRLLDRVTGNLVDAVGRRAQQLYG